MASSRWVNIVAWIVQLLVAVAFFGAGGSKLAGAAPMVEMYNTIGWGQWFRYVTGLIEVGSGLLVLVPSLAVYGAALLICAMVGAIIAHLAVLNSPPTQEMDGSSTGFQHARPCVFRRHPGWPRSGSSAPSARQHHCARDFRNAVHKGLLFMFWTDTRTLASNAES